MRLLAVLMAVALVVLPAPAAGADPTREQGVRVEHALAVLHAWDERRSQAWASSDRHALAALYVRRSSAARADVRLLGSYTARGFVVRRIVTQVFGLRVLVTTPDRLVMRVLDRVAGGQVVTPDGTVPLPSTRPVVRRIVLARVAGAWRVASVTGSG
jgi:hypothetical protein